MEYTGRDKTVVSAIEGNSPEDLKRALNARAEQIRMSFQSKLDSKATDHSCQLLSLSERKVMRPCGLEKNLQRN